MQQENAIRVVESVATCIYFIFPGLDWGDFFLCSRVCCELRRKNRIYR